MVPKNDLHQLIHSLSKSEKRYFNLFAKRHVIGSKNNYIKLFEAIEKQSKYNESVIKMALKYPDNYVNLPSEKNYLKELILKSLKQFHEKNFTDSILYDRLIQIEILYEKGLFEMGYELINKSIKMAEKYQKYLIHATLMLWKINYDIKLNRFDLVSDDILISQQQTDQFNEYIGYMSGSFNLLSVYRKLVSSNDINLINKAVEKFKDYEKKKEPSSVLGAYYFYSIRAFVADLKKDKLATLKNFESSLNVFKKNLFFIEERPNLFFISSNNYIVSLIENEELKKAEKELNYLKSTVDSLNLTGQLKARTFLIISDNRLQILKKQNNWEDANVITKEIEKGLALHEKYIDPLRKIDLYFSLSMVHFNAKEFRLSNKFLNKIMKEKSDPTMDRLIIAFVMITQLVLMVESKELYLLKNKILSTKRYIDSKVNNEWMSLFLDFLIALTSNKRSKFDYIRDTSGNLISIVHSDPTIQRLNSYFDLEKWLIQKGGTNS